MKIGNIYMPWQAHLKDYFLLGIGLAGLLALAPFIWLWVLMSKAAE